MLVFVRKNVVRKYLLFLPPEADIPGPVKLKLGVSMSDIFLLTG